MDYTPHKYLQVAEETGGVVKRKVLFSSSMKRSRPAHPSRLRHGSRGDRYQTETEPNDSPLNTTTGLSWRASISVGACDANAVDAGRRFCSVEAVLPHSGRGAERAASSSPEEEPKAGSCETSDRTPRRKHSHAQMLAASRLTSSAKTPATRGKARREKETLQREEAA